MHIRTLRSEARSGRRVRRYGQPNAENPHQRKCVLCGASAKGESPNWYFYLRETRGGADSLRVSVGFRSTGTFQFDGLCFFPFS